MMKIAEMIVAGFSVILIGVIGFVVLRVISLTIGDLMEKSVSMRNKIASGLSMIFVSSVATIIFILGSWFVGWCFLSLKNSLHL